MTGVCRLHGLTVRGRVVRFYKTLGYNRQRWLNVRGPFRKTIQEAHHFILLILLFNIILKKLQLLVQVCGLLLLVHLLLFVRHPVPGQLLCDLLKLSHVIRDSSHLTILNTLFLLVIDLSQKLVDSFIDVALLKGILMCCSRLVLLLWLRDVPNVVRTIDPDDLLRVLGVAEGILLMLLLLLLLLALLRRQR